jgi:cysteine synthase A
MPDWMSRERVAIIASFGAEIVPVSRRRAASSARSAARRGTSRAIRGVPAAPVREPGERARARARPGPRSCSQLEAFGAARCVRRRRRHRRHGDGRRRVRCARVPEGAVHPLEPANSPTLRTGHKVGKHRIQGISDEFVPAVVDLDWLDAIVDVWDGDAILMAQALARASGSRSASARRTGRGANFLGAAQLVEELGAPGRGHGVLRQQQEVPVDRPLPRGARCATTTWRRASSWSGSAP